MSTFDPNLEPTLPPTQPGPPQPPGDWQTDYAQQGHPAGEKAAVYVWLCSATLLLMSGCCGLSGIALLSMSTSQILENMPAHLPVDEQVMQMLPYLGPIMAIGSLVLLFVPSLVLAILAFWIRTGGRAVTVIALVIIGIQCGVFALALLNYLFALLQIPSAGMVMLVVIIGVITGLFVKTAFELINALKATRQTAAHQGW